MKRSLAGLLVSALSAYAMAASAQPITPPSGYSAVPSTHPTETSNPTLPSLTRVPDEKLSELFRVDPSYPKPASVKVAGVFAITESAKLRVEQAWASGFLPILVLSDGRCALLNADYYNGTLSNGRLSQVACSAARKTEQTPPYLPSDDALKLVSYSWGYSAWTDDRNGTTVVTAPFLETFVPLFTARMPSIAMMAMNAPDAPMGNVTLIGRIDGQLMVVVLEVSYDRARPFTQTDKPTK